MAADSTLPTPGTPAWDAAMVAKAETSRRSWQKAPDAAAQADFMRSAQPPRGPSTTPSPQAFANEDVLATAKTTSGFALMGSRPVTEGDVVSVNGMDMRVSYALARGYLVKDAGGNITRPSMGGTGRTSPFVEASPAQPRAAEEAPRQTREDASEEPVEGAEEATDFRADDTTEEVMTAICAAPSASSVIHELTSRGEVSEGLLTKLASDLGMSREEASAHVTTAVEGLRAAAAIATGMTDPANQAAFDAWLAESPERLRRSRLAARSIGQENDLRPLRKLVKEWRSSR